MARISTKDPLDKFRWAIRIDGFTRMGFTNCEVPSVSINVQSYPEGGAHLTPRKIIDSVEYKPVTLQRGVGRDSNFHEWASSFIKYIQGAEDNNNPGGDPITNYRKEIRIDHLDRAGRVIKTYVLHNAFPIEYKPASDFDSGADDGMSMEKLVLTYESFEVINNNAAKPSPFDPSDILKRVIKRF